MTPPDGPADAAARARAALVAAYVARRPPRPPGGRQGQRRARAKLAAGRPLLHDERLDLDVVFVVGLARVLLDEAGRRGEPRAAPAAAALTSATIDLGRAVEEAFVGHGEHLSQLTRPAGSAAGPLAAALAEAALPLLRLAAAAVTAYLDLAPWGRAYCPACGAAGAQAGPAGLRCPRCETAWPGEYRPAEPGFELELALPGLGDDEEWRDA